MSRLAPPTARHVAILAVLVGALGLVLSALLVQGSVPATASTASSNGAGSGSTPSPLPSSKAATAPSPSAHLTLERVDCDSVRLSITSGSATALEYRVTDESGRTATSGTFTGSVSMTLSLSTGHDYTATAEDPGTGARLASSGAASLRQACTVSVAADPPEFEDACGTEHDAVYIPRIIGVDYLSGEGVLLPGANAATGTVTVVAAARPGYTLIGPSRWTRTFAADPCLAAPEPAVPAGPRAAPGASVASPPGIQASPSTVPHAERPSPAGAPASPRNEQDVHADPQPAVQASVGTPGPIAWGIMIALALAAGIVFWLKTRH